MRTVLFFLLMTVFHTGRSQEVLPLWSGEIPDQKKSEEEERLIPRDNLLWIENVQQPTLEVYLPAAGNATGQAVVIFPGGGYQGLAYDWEGTDIAKWLNGEGIAGIVVKYRLPVSPSVSNQQFVPLQDAQRALRMVRANAENWNIDAEVGVMGFSAGGHLASTLGTHWDYPAYQPVDNDQFSARPDFMILMYPVISFTKNQHQGSLDALLGEDQTDESITFFSNELQVTNATPPTILIHATDDAAVPVENSLLFYQALKEKEVYAELHTYPYGGHGFSLSVNDPYLHSWTDRVIDFIEHLPKQP